MTHYGLKPESCRFYFNVYSSKPNILHEGLGSLAAIVVYRASYMHLFCNEILQGSAGPLYAYICCFKLLERLLCFRHSIKNRSHPDFKT